MSNPNFVSNDLRTLLSDTTRFWDDGSGVISPHQASTLVGENDLVPVPMIPGMFLSTITGSSAVTYIEGGSKNRDGSQSHLQMLRKGGLQQTCEVRAIVWGRTVGVRWERTSSSPAFIVTIDGIPYRCPEPNPKFNGSAVSITDAFSQWIVARDLDDGPHSVLIEVEPSGSDQTLLFYGWLLEKAAGYDSRAPRNRVVFDSTLTTSATAISHNGASTNPTGDLVTVRKIIYTNIHASAAATVTIKQSSNIIWQKSIAAGDSAEFDFGAPTGLVSFTHQASAGSSINATVIGMA